MMKMREEVTVSMCTGFRKVLYKERRYKLRGKYETPGNCQINI